MKRISYVSFIALVSASSGLLFGFDTGVIADTQWQLTELFSLSSFEWSLIVSAMILGAFLGALCSGMVSDKLGRKKTLSITAYLFIIATIWVSAGQGFYSLYLGRFLLGVSIGVAAYTAPLFIAEIAPTHLRGRFVLFNSVAITGGEALSFLVGYGLEDRFESSWRLMFLMGLLPAMFLLLGLYFVPQSPRWLMKKNQKEKAYAALLKIRGGNIYHEWEGIKEINENKNEKNIYRMLWNMPYRKLMLLGVGLGILQQFCGINIIMYYGPYLFNHAGFSKSSALLATFSMGLVNLVFTLVALFIIDKIGRRALVIHGSAVAGLALLVLAATFFFNLYAIVVFISVFIFCMAFAMSLGCCFWLLIAELYPLHLRVPAMSIASAVQWLSNFLVSLLFLPLFESIGPGITMLIFAACCFFASLFGRFFVPETKDISLESIEKNLMKGYRLRDLGRGLTLKRNTDFHH